MARFENNLIVIGGGSAGLIAALIAATVKAKVTLIERDRMGGDCLNTGCVPSKALIRSAKVAHEFRTAARFGGEGNVAKSRHGLPIAAGRFTPRLPARSGQGSLSVACADNRVHSVCTSLRVLPNPSFKRSANGRPPGPVCWYAVHFQHTGPGSLPLSPA